MRFFDKKNIVLFLIIGIAIAGALLVLTKKSATEEEIKKPPQETAEQKGEEENLDSIQKQTTTASQTKIYRNEEWGFEFEYPEGWIFHANTFGGLFSKFNLVGASPEENNLPNPIYPSILINIVMPDFAERANINLGKLNASTSTVVVAATQGTKYEYEFEGTRRISIYLPLGEYQVNLGAQKKHEDVFNLILATFKFIKSGGSTETKIYRNEKYGFEMQISMEWAPFENQGRLTLNEIPGQPFGDNLFFFIISSRATTSESLTLWFRRGSEFTEINAREMFEVANRTYGEGFLKITDFSVLVENKVINDSEVIVQTIRCLKSDCYFLGWPQHSKEYYIKRDDVIFKLAVITMQPETYFGLLDRIASTFKFIESNKSNQ